MDWAKVRRILVGFLLAGVAIVATRPNPSAMLLPALLAAPAAVLIAIAYVWLDGALNRYNARKQARKPGPTP